MLPQPEPRRRRDNVQRLVFLPLPTFAMLYGLLFSGLEFLLAEPLCASLYGNAEAGKWLRLYAPLIPMLYCDAITDAMTKGLGQQKICVRYNILTNAMDVAFLYLLLPKFGMKGYYFSFFITHLVNFVLSLRRLLRITGEAIPFSTPTLSAAAALAAVWGASRLTAPAARVLLYPVLLGCLLSLFRILRGDDLRWMWGLLRRKKAES